MTNDLFGAELSDDLLDHLEDPEVRKRWPQTLWDMVTGVRHTLQKHGMAEAEAKRMSLLIIADFANWFGGRMEYLPRGDALAMAIKHRQIWDDYDHRNVRDLARKHNLTDVRIYEIIREQRALHHKRLHQDLFKDEETVSKCAS